MGGQGFARRLVSTNPADSAREQVIELDGSGVPINPAEKPMGFLDHLEELRWTLVKCVAVFIVMASLIAYFIGQFNDVLMWPLHHVQAENPKLIMELGTTSIMEGFNVTLQLCGYGGLVMASPFILIFIGQFVAPALSKKEARLALPVGFSALILFLLGAAFGFFLLVPSTIRISLELNEQLGFTLRWTPDSYYSLLVWLVMGVGVAFEFPLLIVLAIHLGFLRVETLRKYRRHAIVAIFIIAAVVTPTPDPFTQTMFAAPLYVLFELAILVGAQVQKRREARLG
jgi:sec-independent protein translocase protein TatC